MILTEDNGGTRISSTRYMHYGTVTANCEWLTFPVLLEFVGSTERYHQHRVY